MILANVAIPTFFSHSALSLVGLVVIAAVEAVFLFRIGVGLYRDCYRAALEANVWSTFLGIPLAWLLWTVGLIPVMWGADILGMESHPLIARIAIGTFIQGGMIPSEWTHIGREVGMMLMLVPFFFGSVWMERKIYLRRFPGIDRVEITRAVRKGNLTSYLFFLLLSLVGVWNAILHYPEQKEFSDSFHMEEPAEEAR